MRCRSRSGYATPRGSSPALLQAATANCHANAMPSPQVVYGAVLRNDGEVRGNDIYAGRAGVALALMRTAEVMRRGKLRLEAPTTRTLMTKQQRCVLSRRAGRQMLVVSACCGCGIASCCAVCARGVTAEVGSPCTAEALANDRLVMSPVFT